MTILKIALPVFLLLQLIFDPLAAQTDHYEQIFSANTTYKYATIKNSADDQRDAGWRTPEFDDSHWEEGVGGIGLGDNDDGTTIGRGYSVYMRKWFVIKNIDDITQLLLLADYDDGFVAFINGIEVVRANMPIDLDYPPYNQRATGSHEATMFSGGYPESFIIDSAALSVSLREGENLIAFQVHNESSGSRDMSSNFYLIGGLNVSETAYSPLPDWYHEMITNFSSTLPLIVINTFGEEIPDEPKIPGWMKIYNKGEGETNSFLDSPDEYDGNIAIEQRGNSSRWMYVDDGKISFSLETQDSLGENNNVKLLGMPKENDWVLYGPYSDKTMLKNVLAYWIGNNTGAWAPRTKYVDVVLNGKQMGIFAFMEKVKRDDDRVDIARMDLDDIRGDSLTGGYIVKVDRNTGWDRESWDSPYPPTNAIDQTVSWVLVYPRPEVVQNEQLNYIKRFIGEFENTMNSPNYLDPTNGYRSIVDIGSFVDFFLIGELFRDADSFRSSMYFHKDRDSINPKLKLGPLWDFNYSMGNYDICGCASSSGWAYLFNYYCNERFKINPFWWEKIVQDDFFNNLAVERWTELRQSAFSEETIFNFIDSTTNYLEPSRIRNFQIWPILDVMLWPNFYIGETYENEIDFLKTWIHERLLWIDENIPLINSSSTIKALSDNISTFSIYPNPAQESTTFKIENAGPGELMIQIFSPTGQKIDEIKHSLGYSGTWLIPFSIRSRIADPAVGVYSCCLFLNQVPISTQLLIVQ